MHTPILFELIKMSETEFSIGFVLFGLFNVLTNQLTTRFLLPKLGSTNCLILARVMYAFIPFLIFYFSSYNIFILLSIFWGISIGIQAPNIFTQGYDLLQYKDDAIAYTLGRHTNDYMTSFYSIL